MCDSVVEVGEVRARAGGARDFLASNWHSEFRLSTTCSQVVSTHELMIQLEPATFSHAGRMSFRCPHYWHKQLLDSYLSIGCRRRIRVANSHPEGSAIVSQATQYQSLARLERVIGIEPTTFSLGIRSGENGACEGDGGLGQASEGEESVCDDAGSASCDEDEDT